MRSALALAIFAGAVVAAIWPASAAAEIDAGGRIQVGLPRFRYELQAAGEAYAKLYPEVSVIFSENPFKARRDFLAGQVDVLGYCDSNLFHQDRASRDELQEYGKTHSKPPQELTVAYWPYAVAVHPANPMKAITVAQLRQLFFNPEARWPHLGRSTDGRIRLYVVDSRRIAQALVAPGKEREAQQLSSRAVSKHRVPTPTIIGDAIYKAMADDKDGIVVWMHSNQLADIGFKNLPIVGAPGKPGALPTDVAAVASGRYPLRLPLRIATHPGAPAHVQAFAAWLQTPQAGEAMALAEISHANYPSPIAHVSMAEKDVP